MKPTIINIEEALSTNSFMAEMDRETPTAHGTVVAARRQTAGRGQRGNSWESEPGMNITMSMMIRPEGVEAMEQFALSEAVALGVAEAIEQAMGGDIPVEVKWPNDIYVDNRKICGILIENVLAGRRIERSIAGVGVNVNQTTWRTDAPNPVSMAQLTGEEYDIEKVAEEIGSRILTLLELTASPEGRAALHDRYLLRLWRREGFYRWTEAASGLEFEARIEKIAPTGHITLRERDGKQGEYAFKEVAAIL